MDTNAPVTCVVEARDVVGESPLWDPDQEAVYWTDVNGFRIHRYRLADADVTTWRFDEPVTALSLTTDPSRILVALGSQVILWTPVSDARTLLARPEPRTPYNRLNDGATDPNGAFWIGSMRNNVAVDGGHVEASDASGCLYRVAGDGEVTLWDTGYGITNTLAWSPDRRTFYCGCSVANVIYAYDYDMATGAVSGRRPFAAGMERGVPDGSAVDSDGFLWNCRFSGAGIVRFAPDGTIDTVVEMPVSNVTNCAFGGPDLRTLYVTTASLHAAPGEARAGSLFALRTDVAGLETTRFRIA